MLANHVLVSANVYNALPNKPGLAG